MRARSDDGPRVLHDVSQRQPELHHDRKPQQDREIIGYQYRGYKGIMAKERETTIIYWGYIRIMEKRMETTTVTTIVCCAYIWIMEKKMETTILYIGITWG